MNTSKNSLSLPTNVTIIAAQLGSRYGYNLTAMYLPIVRTLQIQYCHHRFHHVVFPMERNAVAVITNASQQVSVLSSVGEGAHLPCAFFWIGEGRLPTRVAKMVSTWCSRHRYETEPVAHGGVARRTAVRLWTYTRAHVHAGYLPPQYVPSTFPLSHLDPLPVFVGHLSSRLNVKPPCAVFQQKGKWLRAKKMRSYGGTVMVDEHGVPAFRHVGNAWSEAQLSEQIGNSSIFVNLHKDCRKKDAPLEAFRLAALLSKGAIIVSQRSNPQDEREFVSLVDFVDDAKFWPFVARLAALGRQERHRLGSTRMENFARRSARTACRMGTR